LIEPMSSAAMASMAGLRAEDELVVLLSSSSRSEAADARCRSLLDGHISWEAVLARGAAHGVLPLLTRNLERLGSPGVPAPVVAALWASNRVNAARNAALAEELRRVLVALSNAGVPAIPLKGVALAESLYGEMALRVCSDLDILVPRSMVRRALDALGAMDYLPELGERSVVDLMLRHDIECGLARGADGTAHVLDLHWGIAWGGSRDEVATTELWNAALDTLFHGIPARALSPEWEVLFLALHAARHRWQGLKWLVDVHEVCLRGGIDWGRVRVAAARFGWEEPLRITLVACHVLFGTPLTVGLDGEGLPPWLTLLADDPLAPGDWRDAVLPLRLLRPASQKVRYLFRLLLAPTMAEYRLVCLPFCLGPLYYLLRPLRLGAKYSVGALRSWRGAVRAASALTFSSVRPNMRKRERRAAHDFVTERRL
jgi:hypothetical protein